MKKIFLSLLVLFGACGAITAQTPYKVLEVYKGGEVTHTISLADIDSLTVKTIGDDDLNGHEYVDLGLPSGTLWATTNVGAASPADCGDYFAWGETAPKENYSWSTYKWSDATGDTFSKYNSDASWGTVDNKDTLEPADDAATANWGDEWRTPTSGELRELMVAQYCTWTWTTKTNSKGETINGYEVKSNINGNSIFLPVTGYYYESTSYMTGSYGYYLSSSIHYSSQYCSYSASFNSNMQETDDQNRSLGMPVRPVRASAQK